MNNVNPMTNLEKHWKRLHMTLTVDNQVSVRQIAKTFASGRAAEKLVYSTLSDCGFPSGKVSEYPLFFHSPTFMFGFGRNPRIDSTRFCYNFKLLQDLLSKVP